MSEIKIRKVVDEDWKARIQREKEEARLKAAAEAATAEPAAPSPDPAAAPAPSDPVPPPSDTVPSPAAEPAPSAPDDSDPKGDVNPMFEGLVNMLATQAMYCLGLLGAQGGQEPVNVNLEQAKEAIDLILMLREKTRGNLVPGEASVLDETASELQRLFAARMQQAQAQAMQQAGIDPQNLQGGMLPQ